MGTICELVGKIIMFFFFVIAGLFAVYFLNLDQKVMGWAYTQVNEIFDRKKTDIKF